MARQHNHEPDKVEAVIRHPVEYEPQTAKRLIRDTERADTYTKEHRVAARKM